MPAKSTLQGDSQSSSSLKMDYFKKEKNWTYLTAIRLSNIPGQHETYNKNTAPLLKISCCLQ